jgi:hypothetical protein
MSAGAQIYADECSGCHAANGKGSLGIFPSLNGRRKRGRPIRPPRCRRSCAGKRSAGTDKAPTAPAMPAFRWVLGDDQVVVVPPVSAGDVSKQRRALVERGD